MSAAARGGLALSTASLVLGAALGLLGALDVVGASEGGLSEASGPCMLTVTQRTAAIGGGEAIVTNSLRSACRGARRPLYLVLLIDASDELGAAELRDLQDGLVDAVRGLGLEDRDDLRVGVVSFADTARTIRQPAADTERIVSAIRDIVPGGASCLPCGIEEAVGMLRSARGAPPDLERREVILLASGGSQGGCGAVREKAGEVQRYGMLLVAACRGRDCDRGCIADAVSRPRYLLPLDVWSLIGERIGELAAERGPFSPVDEVRLTQDLHPAWTYVEGGAPTGGVGNRLEWSFWPWVSDAVTRSFRIATRGCGHIPVSLPARSGASLIYDQAIVPLPPVTRSLPATAVEIPCLPPPTSSAPPGPSATPTPTATPTATPTTTPTATREGSAPSATPTRPAPGRPTATATPQGPDPTGPRPAGRAFLPLALGWGCAAPPPPRRLLLALDVSYSMALEETRTGVSAWELGRRIALAAYDGLRPGRDELGIVAFGGGLGPRGQAVLPLAPCCSPARRAEIEAFWRLDGSRVDRALAQAAHMLTEAPAAPGARSELLLVTDGDPNDTPRAALDAALDALRDAGVRLHVAQLGEAPDPALLAALRRAGARVHVAADLPALGLAERLAAAPRCAR